MLFSHYRGEGDGDDGGGESEGGGESLICLGMRCVTGNCVDGVLCTAVCRADAVADSGDCCVEWKLELVGKMALSVVE